MSEIFVKITENVISAPIVETNIAAKIVETEINAVTEESVINVAIEESPISVKIESLDFAFYDLRYFLKYIWTAETTNAAATEMLRSSAQLIVGENESWVFNINLIGTDESTQDSVVFCFKGGIKRKGSNTSIIGERSKEANGRDAGAAGWDADVMADDSSEALKITVTGEVGKNISWRASGQITKIEL